MPATRGKSINKPIVIPGNTSILRNGNSELKALPISVKTLVEPMIVEEEPPIPPFNELKRLKVLN